jgi:hypothetical protein
MGRKAVISSALSVRLGFVASMSGNWFHRRGTGQDAPSIIAWHGLNNQRSRKQAPASNCRITAPST